MEWKKVRLDTLCSQIRGVSYKKEEIFEEYIDGTIPLLRANNILGKGKLELEKVLYVKKNRVKDEQLILKGDIIIAASSGSIDIVGKSGQAKDNLNKTFGAFCKLIRNKNKNILSSEYLGCFFNSPYYKREIRNSAEGANINNLRNEHIDQLEIPLPPIEIQIKIAEALDKAQELIDNRKLQLEKYDELIQSIFIEMFGDPVTNPKKWEVKRLKEISTKILSGNTPKGGSNVYIKKGIPFFRSQNVWRNKIKYEDIVYIDEAIHRSMQKSSLKNRDILITKTGRINTENSSLGRAAMFLGEDNKGNINGHVYLVRLKKCMVDRFVLYIITTDKYREYIRSICVGAIDKRQINKNHLEEFPIINPPIELQSKFASIVEKIENEKKLCEESLKQMEENFKTMIHKAFRGELF